ncbi:ditrans,polycis-polyprenyl diphosphate synthase [(2E,6E)-farnesydiphosphate specific] [Ranunculus cassubicifolius]
MDFTLEDLKDYTYIEILGILIDFLRICILRILSIGPIPRHMAFIMDGNRRFAKRRNLRQGAGHRVGFLALLSTLKYCHELGVRYVTVYAFALDNFKRRPEEVDSVMELLEEKSLELLDEENMLNRYGIKVQYMGNLHLLSESTRTAVEKAMKATAKNDKTILSICVAYSSTDEIVHATEEVYHEKKSKKSSWNIQPADLEKHMYMGGIPDPEILIRTSGETRLSNFLLWQTTFSYLDSPSVLWPGISVWTLLWVILNYQRAQPYLRKKMKYIMDI